MDDSFPSFWMEVDSKSKDPTIVSGFYREWSLNKENTKESQILHLKVFCGQIERAAVSTINMIMLGDSNQRTIL